MVNNVIVGTIAKKVQDIAIAPQGGQTAPLPPRGAFFQCKLKTHFMLEGKR